VAALAAGGGSFAIPLALPPDLLIALPAALAYAWSLAVAECGMRNADFDQGSGIRDQGSEDYATRNTLHVSRFTFHASRFTFHVLWLGWAGLGRSVLLAGLALPAPWDIAGAGGMLIAAAVLGRLPAVPRWAARTQAIGWLALGVALITTLLPG
jgi:hypothetical protein